MALWLADSWNDEKSCKGIAEAKKLIVAAVFQRLNYASNNHIHFLSH
jgi:hypothetical protein